MTLCAVCGVWLNEIIARAGAPDAKASGQALRSEHVVFDRIQPVRLSPGRA
jgi:hypothetical protein